jgi:hypothetical protein
MRTIRRNRSPRRRHDELDIRADIEHRSQETITTVLYQSPQRARSDGDTVVKSRAFKLKMHFGYLKWFRYYVSKAIMIQQAILDNGGHFSPGRYTLKAMPESRRTGKGQQGSNTRPDPKPRPKPTIEKTATRVITPMRDNAPTRST